MARSLFLVCDEPNMIEKVRDFGQMNGIRVKVYSPNQWSQMVQNPEMQGDLMGEQPLAHGANPVNERGYEGKVLPFPVQRQQESMVDDSDSFSQKIMPINEMESVAIQNAIYEFKGNLTEAARALGIGRATLYRKVKLYNIDPSEARKRRKAA